MFHAVRLDLMCWTLLCLFGKRPREVTSREKATKFVSNDLLVLLEPLSVFQDKTFREELWYLDVLCLKSRFVSISINTQRRQFAHGMAVNPKP